MGTGQDEHKQLGLGPYPTLPAPVPLPTEPDRWAGGAAAPVTRVAVPQHQRANWLTVVEPMWATCRCASHPQEPPSRAAWDGGPG